MCLYLRVHPWVPHSTLYPAHPGYTLSERVARTEHSGGVHLDQRVANTLLGSVIPAGSGQPGYGRPVGEKLLHSDGLDSSASELSWTEVRKDRIGWEARVARQGLAACPRGVSRPFYQPGGKETV